MVTGDSGDLGALKEDKTAAISNAKVFEQTFINSWCDNCFALLA